MEKAEKRYLSKEDTDLFPSHIVMTGMRCPKHLISLTYNSCICGISCPRTMDMSTIPYDVTSLIK
jgi:hypothetical protein